LRVVLLALMFNVLFDHLLVEPERGGEISDAPNIAVDVL